MNDLVSVIVPTYNSQKTIERCLVSIKAQTYKRIELIVIDKLSSDKSIGIAKKYANSVYTFNATERCQQKNFGISKSKGEFIFFIDSDMELTPEVIEEAVLKIRNNPNNAGIVIPERSIGNSFWVKVRDFEKLLISKSDIESARFFRKNLVDMVQGFDEDIIFMEESALPQKIEKLGYNVKSRTKAPILHIEDNFSIFAHLRKKIYYGQSMVNYKNNYKYAENQLGIFYRSKVIFNNREFYKKPILGLFVILLKTLEFILCIYGACSHNFRRNSN